MKKMVALFQKLSILQIFLIIFCVGFGVYFNSLSNGFIADDFLQLKDNLLIRSLSNIPRFFSGTNFDDKGAGVNNYYRPIQPTIYSVIYSMFGDNPVPYRALQISVHIINSTLIFLIFKFFFKKEVAFFLSLLFLVHPINSEAVIYVAILTDILSLMFGLTALYLMMKVGNSLYLLPLVAALELLAILSKETGVAFLILIPLFNFLFQKRKLWVHFVQSVVVLIFYLFLRYGVAQLGFNGLKIVPIMTLPLGERLLSIPKIIFFYLKTFFIPSDLTAFQDWYVKSLNFTDFYLPFLFDFIFFAALVFSGFKIFKNSAKAFRVFALFFVWLLVGLGFHLQIIPIDQTVADRYFYFAVVGLLGIIGITIESLRGAERRSNLLERLLHFVRNDSKWFKNDVVWILLAFLIIASSSVRTVIRNSNWKDELTLYGHDFQNNKNSHQIETGLGHALFSAGRVEEAGPHYIKAANLYPSPITFRNLGTYYSARKMTAEAIGAFQNSLNYGDYFVNYSDLALLLLATEEPSVAKDLIERGLEKFPKYSTLWADLGIAKYLLGDKNGAIDAVKKAQAIYPTAEYPELVRAFENNVTLEIH